jgi:hypothetical protein
MIDLAAQPVLETLDEAVASIAEREQAISGTGEVLSSLQGAHGSLECGGRDQTHAARIMESQRRQHKGLPCAWAPRVRQWLWQWSSSRHFSDVPST